MKHLSELDTESKIIIISIIMAISAVLIINHIEEAKAAHFVDPGNLTVEVGAGHDVYVYPLTRQEQIKLMAECIEDSTAVMSWWRGEFVRDFHIKKKTGYDPGEDWKIDDKSYIDMRGYMIGYILWCSKHLMEEK